jgi:hypothetical protein
MAKFLSCSMFALLVGVSLTSVTGCGSKTESTVIEQPTQTPEEAAAAAAAYEESMK